MWTESELVENPIWESAHFDKTEISEYFMLGPRGGSKINWMNPLKINSEDVEKSQLDRFHHNLTSDNNIII